MVEEIRIYIEGGGDGKNSKNLIRQGFSDFFQELRDIARSKRIKWHIVTCGSRNATFRDFINALEDHPTAFNILLVDSEAPVAKLSPWDHLKDRDRWSVPQIDDKHCHLMVQMMESWLLADVDALSKFYGQGFNLNSLPRSSNVETIDKGILENALKAATRNTKSKGEYQKINHAWQLLGILDVKKVRNAAPYCDRLFQTLEERMSS